MDYRPAAGCRLHAEHAADPAGILPGSCSSGRARQSRWVERNRAKAGMLYDAIDASGIYSNPVAKNCRSWMNVPFRIAKPGLEKAFLAEADAA